MPGKDGDKIVYDAAPLAGPVAAGDVIAVRLTVTGSEWKYLMLEDPIPAGTEFIERDNNYQLTQPAAVVGVLVHAPRTARRPLGDFPDLVPAGPAAVFLSAEGGESRRVPGESGARGADVSAGT